MGWQQPVHPVVYWEEFKATFTVILFVILELIAPQELIQRIQTEYFYVLPVHLDVLLAQSPVACSLAPFARLLNQQITF